MKVLFLILVSTISITAPLAADPGITVEVKVIFPDPPWKTNPNEIHR